MILISKEEILLREFILAAEDMQFPEHFAKLLIDFAIKEKDNENSSYGSAVVHSAIRTGASMLRLDKVDLLIPLLQRGSVINTTIITLKMIGRIFEATPPCKLNQHEKIADIVLMFVYGYTPRFTDDAVYSELAIRAVAAMASDRLIYAIRLITTDVDFPKWFKNDVLRDLQRLYSVWCDKKPDVDDGTLKPLVDSIMELKKSI